MIICEWMTIRLEPCIAGVDRRGVFRLPRRPPLRSPRIGYARIETPARDVHRRNIASLVGVGLVCWCIYRAVLRCLWG